MARAVKGIELSDKIPLEEWDPEGETWVRFQRPRRYEAETLAQMQAQTAYEFNTEERGKVTQRERIPLAVLESAMVSMCLVESNLTLESEEGESVPLFVQGQTCRSPRKPMPDKVDRGFQKVWRDLPDELCEEIVGKLREWHPPFNWRVTDEEA